MKTICIVDDHKLFSSGLELMISSLEDGISCQVFDDAATFLQALSERDGPPDLCIVDFYIPGTYVPDLIRQVLEQFSGTPVLVVSASVVPADRKMALDAGAKLFLNKSSETEVLLDAVKLLLAGETPEIAAPDREHLSGKFNLTPRQIEILLLVSKGFSNKEIANLLEVSPETVKSHLKEIFVRFDVGNRIEAVDFARSNGLFMS